MAKDLVVQRVTGYGIAACGHKALHAALTSCTSSVVVVNIDNGYAAARTALRILNKLDLNTMK